MVQNMEENKNKDSKQILVYRSDKLHFYNLLASIQTFDCIADLANPFDFETLAKFGIGNWDEGSIIKLNENNLLVKEPN